MSDTILGVIIGGTFGFLGALLGNIINIWAEGRKEKRESFQSLRLRLVGDHVQTSEVMRFIKAQREKKWPFFWRRGTADMSRARLAQVDFRDQDLRNAIFYHADLQGANLKHTNMQGSDFAEANLSQASFYKTKASNAIFFRANLHGAEFTSADLVHGNLIWANLSNSILVNAQLNKSDMRSADLTHAKIMTSNLEDVNLAGVNMNGAILENTSLKGAVYNAETAWPEGFDPQQTGAEFIAQCGSKNLMAQAGLAWRWGRLDVGGVNDN